MSILRKPYTIGVYEDVLVGDSFQEKRLGVIGSDKMTSLNRVLEPNLVRNVNGQCKFSFKMYKKYIDPATGKDVQNPFVDWLCSERKVKLEYDNKWFDFIIKDINENSSNYLYVYQLEDANVQELAKNGFGVTLDTELMNNVGTAKELGQYVMEETDWTVEGDVIVQTVEESLVYLTVTSPVVATHILDQVAVDEEYSNGVTIDGTLVTLPIGTKVLAFYSSCKNKPHRFQFIYSDKGYEKTANGYAIDRNDKRVITEKDCQYYIDFDDPNTAYSVYNTTYDLYLPTNFNVIEMIESETTDTAISTWYRGARYGYAQQAEYVPLLEKYCQKFTKPKTFVIDTVIESFDHEDAIDGDLIFGDKSVTYKKQKEYAGIYFNITYDNSEVYKLSYEVNNSSGTMYTLGGHAASFEISQFDVEGFNGTKWEQVVVTPYHTPTLGVYDVPDGKRGYQKYKITATYRKINKEGDGYPQIYIQPNIYIGGTCDFTISNISFGIDQNYYGYTDTDYVSPTLVQNYITNYDFKKTSGWTPTQTTKVSSNTKPTVESFYGRYVDGEFRSIVDDYLKGTYSDLNNYTSYLKMEFKQANQFVLNSGIRDNRTTISNMPEGEEWVFDYKIVDVNNNDVSENFTYRLAEFVYDKESGNYRERTGSMNVGSLTSVTMPENAPFKRGIFKITTNNYTEDQFKGRSGSKGTYLNLQIKPTNPTFSTDDDGNVIPLVYYLEHIALYRKVLDKNESIIVPDYEAQESNAAQEYVDNSTLEHKYNYFNAWHVDGANPKKIMDKEALPLYTANTLKYDTYKPVYNAGAQKVRSVTVKESNYFNILQSIAETFEQWLVIDVQRNSTGAITGKKIKFKNYRGDNNYACFRYGVNLKDIQRTYSSKNIVTKLIVKQNTNELGKDGFCTIQRAGANPTGENYIYDFQYLQNMGIMKADEYLTTNYYMTSAAGPDSALWKNNEVINSTTFNLNGYFPRLKKINEAIIPLNQEIIGLNADLVKENAKKEVAEAEIEASLSGIEQTRLDFHALTGVYPEDAQDGTIGSVENINITAQDDWYTAALVASSGINSIKFTANRKDEQITPREILLTQGTEKVSISNGRYRVKSCGWDGLYVDYEYMHDKKYLLAYDLEIITPETDAPVFSNIGCHNTSFATDFKINIKGINNNVKAESTDHTCMLSGDITSGKYHVDVTGKFNTYADEHSKPCLYIQPNRGEDTAKLEYVVSNVKLYEVDANSGETSYDRTVAAYVSAEITVQPSSGEGSYEITRTFEVKGNLPAGYTDITLPINVTAVDLDRSDVRKYIEELTVYRQSNMNATGTLATVEPIIAAKEQAIELKNQLRKQYLDWKKQLNYLFFKRYSQFIQEGTWINEEYVDDEKYYADAQSVLYNSCYPQVAYTINTLELSQLPGYELFEFDLGDKTWAIDDEFFGVGKHEEVIITELSEMLDDPSKNQIKVQNFKNQFQDLFQKITATVQQTQYNVGSYEKGDALLNASAEKKSQFITDAINNAKSYLSAGQTVESGPSGITITDDSNKKRKLKLVGGAILFSTENPDTKETSWRTGLTNEGINADLITAGRLDAGAVQIMNGKDPVFRWDAYGISAYDASWQNTGGISTIDNINKNKFVRFDKHGIYGINNTTIDGSIWHPTGNDYEGNANKEVDDKATFALTWEGLKVTGNNGVVARIGKQNYTVKDGDNDIEKTAIIKVSSEDKDTFVIDEKGHVTTSGTIKAEDGEIGGWKIDGNNIIKIEKDAQQLESRVGLISGEDNKLASVIDGTQQPIRIGAYKETIKKSHVSSWNGESFEGGLWGGRYQTVFTFEFSVPGKLTDNQKLALQQEGYEKLFDISGSYLECTSSYSWEERSFSDSDIKNIKILKINEDGILVEITTNEIQVDRGINDISLNVSVELEYIFGEWKYAVLNDGSLYSKASRMDGLISTQGNIGGWEIASDGIKSEKMVLLNDSSLISPSLLKPETGSKIKLRIGEKNESMVEIAKYTDLNESAWVLISGDYDNIRKYEYTFTFNPGEDLLLSRIDESSAVGSFSSYAQPGDGGYFYYDVQIANIKLLNNGYISATCILSIYEGEQLRYGNLYVAVNAYISEYDFYLADDGFVQAKMLQIPGDTGREKVLLKKGQILIQGKDTSIYASQGGLEFYNGDYSLNARSGKGTIEGFWYLDDDSTKTLKKRIQNLETRIAELEQAIKETTT